MIVDYAPNIYTYFKMFFSPISGSVSVYTLMYTLVYNTLSRTLVKLTTEHIVH